MIGVAGVVEEAGLFPLAPANVGLGWQLTDKPAVGRVDGDGFLVDVLALHECLVATLGDSAEVVVDVMFGMPIVPMQVPIQRLHVLATADHEGVGAIDVVRTVNAVADSLRRMLAGVEMLATEVGQSPIGRQLCRRKLGQHRESHRRSPRRLQRQRTSRCLQANTFPESDNANGSSPTLRCLPSTAAALRTGGRRSLRSVRVAGTAMVRGVDRSQSFKRSSRRSRLIRKQRSTILSVTHDRRRPLARVRLRGICVGTFGWRFGQVTWRQRG